MLLNDLQGPGRLAFDLFLDLLDGASIFELTSNVALLLASHALLELLGPLFLLFETLPCFAILRLPVLSHNRALYQGHPQSVLT